MIELTITLLILAVLVIHLVIVIKDGNKKVKIAEKRLQVEEERLLNESELKSRAGGHGSTRTKP